MNCVYKRLATYDMDYVGPAELGRFGVSGYSSPVRIEAAVNEILNIGYRLVSVTSVGTISLIYHFTKEE